MMPSSLSECSNVACYSFCPSDIPEVMTSKMSHMSKPRTSVHMRLPPWSQPLCSTLMTRLRDRASSAYYCKSSLFMSS
eukprot:1997165-Amphidinium_carterae.1